MVAVLMHEPVALHLWSQGDADAGGTVAYERSTLGIDDVLDLDETLSSRVELLSTLAGMKDDDLVVENQASVSGFADDRNVYWLTDGGRKLAREVHARFQGETVTVVNNGETSTVALDAHDQALPDLSVPAVLHIATN